MKACGIILAAGQGSRMQADENKVFLKFDNRSALMRCIRIFERTGIFSSLIVVCRDDERELIERKLRDHDARGAIVLCEGGEERQDSVRNALRLVPEDTDIISVHDAARCFVTPEIIERSVLYAARYDSGVAAIPMTDTVKEVTDGVIDQTLDRTRLYRIQTPQSFSADLLRRAYARASEDGFRGTDDASLVERLTHDVRICEGSSQNIKLTVPEDIDEGREIIELRRTHEELRVGTGFDVHPFEPGRALVLGGVEVPNDLGLAGHSDADVLVHAVMDALLGAAGLPDIGKCFPPSDPAFHGISSLLLLRQVGEKIRACGYHVENIDSTVMLERPKIGPMTGDMEKNIADALGIRASRVNVKATTTEKLGAFGRGEGAGAQAVCLLARREDDA